MSVNSVILMGRLGKDPKEVETRSGDTMAVFRIAVDTDQDDDEPMWIDVVCFRQQADAVLDNLSKGDQVIVQGSLRERTWEDDSGRRRAHSVNAYRVDFIKVRSWEKKRRRDYDEDERPSRRRSRDEDDERPRRREKDEPVDYEELLDDDEDIDPWA